MKAILKRYALAFVFLLLVIGLMIIGTMGVMSFGQSMVEDIGGTQMKPRGENLTK